MGSSSTLTPVAFVDPEALVDFLDALRNVGFSISTEQYLAAHDLVLALAAHGAGAADCERLLRMLRPLLCKSPREQQEFAAYFDRWASRLVPIRAKGVSRSESEGTRSTAGSHSRDFANNLDAAGHAMRRLVALERRWLIPIASALIILSLASGIAVRVTRGMGDVAQVAPSPAPNPPAVPPADTANESTRVVPKAQTSGPAPVGDTRTLRPVSTGGDAPPTDASVQESRAPKETGVFLLLNVALLLLLTLAWFLYRRYARDKATELMRRQIDDSEQPHLERLSLAMDNAALFPPLAVRSASAQLRRRFTVRSPALDIERTVTDTLRRGGVFTPAFRSVSVSPEYLALVDRTTPADLQAALVDELLAALRAEHVFVTCYYFDGDPRRCVPSNPRNKPATLRTLAQRYPDHRLLIFGDSQRFFHPLSGEVEPWTEGLRHWASCALLTPESPQHWGATEELLSQEMTVQHADVAGIAATVVATGSDAQRSRNGDAVPAPYPPLLRQRPARWIERSAPAGPDTPEMIEQLQLYLGDAGMLWLASCAVYPALSWKLTLNLGHELSTISGERVLNADRLLRLSRLPWFRHGCLPDWLRLQLLSRLGAEQEDEVRRILDAFLIAAVTGHDSDADLETARDHARTIRPMIGPLLRRLKRRASSPDGAVRDAVFVRFMRGPSSSRLSVRVSRVIPALQGAWPHPSVVKGGRVRYGLTVMGTAAALLIIGGALASWLSYRSFAEKVHDAASKVSALPALEGELPGTIQFPAISSMAHLDSLRGLVATLNRYASGESRRPIAMVIWGGNRLLAEGEQSWLAGYRQLHAAAYSALVDSLRALPDAPRPTDDYKAIYDQLKAYLLLTNESSRSTANFLAPLLLQMWTRGQTLGADYEQVVRRQFEFFSTLLAGQNPWPMSPDARTVEHARSVLRRFSDVERAYQQSVSLANSQMNAVRVFGAVPTASNILVGRDSVPGAYTPAAWSSFGRALDRSNLVERWVLGDDEIPQSAQLEAAIRARYEQDYVGTWRDVLGSVVVVRSANVNDAARRLGVLGGVQSPLLAILAIVSRNTNVDSTVAAAFQPVHAMVPPAATSPYVNDANDSYVRALLALAETMQRIGSAPPATDSATRAERVRYAQVLLERAVEARVAMRRLMQRFAVDAVAAATGGRLSAILAAPIDDAERLGRGQAGMLSAAPDAGTLAAVLNERGRTSCAVMTPMLSKFPFNPDASESATLAGVSGLLVPGAGDL